MARFCPSRGFILDFGGGGEGWGFAVPFYFVQGCSMNQRRQIAHCTAPEVHCINDGPPLNHP